MNKVPDRAKMRREYLGKMAAVNTQKTMGFLVALVCTLLAFAFTVCLVEFLTLGIIDRRPDPVNDGWELISIIGLAIFGYVASRGFRLLRTAEEKERSIAYVAPVRDQIAALPAEEVLLRGSQVSPALQQELLRPVVSEETKAEELLRPAEAGDQSKGAAAGGG